LQLSLSYGAAVTCCLAAMPFAVASDRDDHSLVWTRHPDRSASTALSRSSGMGQEPSAIDWGWHLYLKPQTHAGWLTATAYSAHDAPLHIDQGGVHPWITRSNQFSRERSRISSSILVPVFPGIFELIWPQSFPNIIQLLTTSHFALSLVLM
jgi:hypothetical protein